MTGTELAAQLAAMIAAFFASWQVRTLLGLIVLDLILGVAKAVRIGNFDWRKLADFYRSAVVPYLIGYGGLYLVIGFIVPPTANLLSDGLVTLAWGTLVASLLAAIRDKLTYLYPAMSHGQTPATGRG